MINSIKNELCPLAPSENRNNRCCCNELNYRVNEGDFAD
jgi:hypothetical protein